MNDLITLFVGNAVIALALALLALAAGWCGKPAVAHVIWLLVLVKLVTPPIVRVEGRWGATVGDSASTTKRSDATATAGTNAVSVEREQHAIGTPDARREVHAAPAVATNAAAPARSSTPVRIEVVTFPTGAARQRDSLAWMVGGAWVLGSLLYGVGVMTRVRRFCGLLKQAAPGPQGIDRIVRDVGAQLGVRSAVDVRVLDAAVSPMMVWWGRAVLVLPRSVVERLSPPQQRAIVAHELAHLRRGDHWVRWLEVLTTALLWWHPLVWLARHGLHETEEQSCDAWVVATLSDQNDGRRTYADALVDVLEMTCGIAQPLPVGASGLGRMKHLRRRLVMILDRTPEKSVSRTGKALIVVLAAMLPLAPIRADEETTPTKSAAQPAAASASSSATTSAAPISDSTRKAVESLLEIAQDPNDQVRGAGMEAIVRFGPQAVPVLVEALGDEKAAGAAQSLLAQMDVDGIEGLIEAIDSPKPIVRERALLTLESIFRPNGGGGGGFGPAGEGAAPGGFAPSPGGMGPGGRPWSSQSVSIAGWVIAPAAKASRDQSPAVRRAAVRVLGASSQIAPDPSIAVPLAAALKDDDATVRQLAASAMMSIAHNAPELTAPLSAALSDPDRAVRVAALTALGSSGAGAKSAMPLVTQALKDSDPTVRIAAANALGAMQIPAATPPGSNDPGYGLAPGAFGPQQADMPLSVGAENVWHWCKLRKYDLAKAEADKILKLNPPGQVLLTAFAQVAQSRHMDSAVLIKQIKDVKELKELGDALTKATDDQPHEPQK